MTDDRPSWLKPGDIRGTRLISPDQITIPGMVRQKRTPEEKAQRAKPKVDFPAGPQIARVIPEWVQFCSTVPRQHQIIGVERLIRSPYLALFDEMGAGKTKQVIDAAQVLWVHGALQQVIVICPAAIRSVWADPKWGELRKHLWQSTIAKVIEYHNENTVWSWGKKPNQPLRWIITNYDYIRNPLNSSWLHDMAKEYTTLLVLDESSAVKSHDSIQARECFKLRQLCQRVILLNGTPISNTPADLYMQAAIMDKKILGCKSFTYFRTRHMIMGGFKNKSVIDWRDLEEIRDRMAPHVLRRLKTDCLDLPEKLPPVTITVPLSAKTWELYKELRDEMVAMIDEGRIITAAEAGVRAMRLSQLTSGFLGGVESVQPCKECDGATDDCEECGGTGTVRFGLPPQAVGNEKTVALSRWMADQLALDKNFRVLIWCRFRPELFRLQDLLSSQFDHVGVIVGGQKKEERKRSAQLLDPREVPPGSVAVVGTPASGGMGLTLTATHHVIHLSSGYSLKDRLQADDRAHRIGQMSDVSYYDIVATGPKGQATMDSQVLKAIRSKNDVASWTVESWRSALTEE